MTSSLRKEPHMTPSTRALTPARIVALVLIGLVVLGLGYLRPRLATPFRCRRAPRAGQLTLHACTYATEQGTYAADCGTLVVPENRADPQSRLIALPVTRIRARSAHPAEPVFRLEGGPGITNMNFAKASRFAERPRRRPRRLPRRRRLRRGSTAPRSSRPCSTPTDLLGDEVVPRLRRRASAPARPAARPTASISPATRWRSRSTISRPPARRSATSASTWSARAPARAPR